MRRRQVDAEGKKKTGGENEDQDDDEKIQVIEGVGEIRMAPEEEAQRDNLGYALQREEGGEELAGHLEDALHILRPMPDRHGPE